MDCFVRSVERGISGGMYRCSSQPPFTGEAHCELTGRPQVWWTPGL
jgi:hypothetical protein